MSDGLTPKRKLGEANVGPHEFAPMALWDRLLRHGRCRGCYVARINHPRHDWLPARPLGDRSYPVVPKEAERAV